MGALGCEDELDEEAAGLALGLAAACEREALGREDAAN